MKSIPRTVIKRLNRLDYQRRDTCTDRLNLLEFPSGIELRLTHAEHIVPKTLLAIGLLWSRRVQINLQDTQKCHGASTHRLPTVPGIINTEIVYQRRELSRVCNIQYSVRVSVLCMRVRMNLTDESPLSNTLLYSLLCERYEQSRVRAVECNRAREQVESNDSGI